MKVSGWRAADVPLASRGGSEYWETDFRVNGGAAAGGLDKLWARKKIAALMDRRVAGTPAPLRIVLGAFLLFVAWRLFRHARSAR